MYKVDYTKISKKTKIQLIKQLIEAESLLREIYNTIDNENPFEIKTYLEKYHPKKKTSKK